MNKSKGSLTGRLHGLELRQIGLSAVLAWHRQDTLISWRGISWRGISWLGRYRTVATHRAMVRLATA